LLNVSGSCSSATSAAIATNAATSAAIATNAASSSRLPGPQSHAASALAVQSNIGIAMLS
jgi:hypothetical protein